MGQASAIFSMGASWPRPAGCRILAGVVVAGEVLGRSALGCLAVLPAGHRLRRQSSIATTVPKQETQLFQW